MGDLDYKGDEIWFNLAFATRINGQLNHRMSTPQLFPIMVNSHFKFGGYDEGSTKKIPLTAQEKNYIKEKIA